MNKAELIARCADAGISPNRRLGQNFLFNETIIARIVAAAGIQPTDRVLEIGPGMGTLTEAIAERAASVHAIEIDAGLARHLRDAFAHRDTVTISHADFLKSAPVPGITKIISNLPYYCASEILFAIAIGYANPETYVMLQREMAARIAARPGGKDYGALTVTLGFYFSMERLFDIDKQSFHPAPEVTSTFIRLARTDIAAHDARWIERFHTVVKSAFWGRRKPILGALVESPHARFVRDGVIAALASCMIPPNTRAERLSVDDYRALTEALAERE